MGIHFNLVAFVLYLLIAGYTTIVVGNALYKNGAIFLKSIFSNKTAFVGPVNTLLLVGYYLINLGFVLFFFTQGRDIRAIAPFMEFITNRLGTVFITLGLMHAFNIMVFIIIESKMETHTSNH